MRRIAEWCILTAGVLAVVAAIGCSSGQRGPDRTVRRFFRAINEKDVNQLLTCFDPRQERMFKATFRLVEKATGFPLDDFFELIPGLAQAFGAEGPQDLHFSRVRILSRTITGSTARLSVSVQSIGRSGARKSVRTEEMEFVLEQFEDAGWRIVAITPRH